MEEFDLHLLEPLHQSVCRVPVVVFPFFFKRFLLEEISSSSFNKFHLGGIFQEISARDFFKRNLFLERFLL